MFVCSTYLALLCHLFLWLQPVSLFQHHLQVHCEILQEWDICLVKLHQSMSFVDKTLEKNLLGDPSIGRGTPPTPSVPSAPSSSHLRRPGRPAFLSARGGNPIFLFFMPPLPIRHRRHQAVRLSAFVCASICESVFHPYIS